MKAFLTLAALIALVPPANAQTQCHTLADFKELIAPQMLAGATITPLPVKDIPAFLIKFNANPPPSQYEADDIEIVTIPADMNKVVVVFNAGCFQTYQRVTVTTFQMLMGDPS